MGEATKVFMASVLAGMSIAVVGKAIFPNEVLKNMAWDIVDISTPTPEDKIDRDYSPMILPRNPYAGFRFQDELSDILKHAKRIGVEPELLMAVRTAENGIDKIAYGIMPQGAALDKYKKDRGYNTLEGKFVEYKDEKEKQLSWAGWTLKKNFERFENDSREQSDFIDFLADVYCPIGADNDPHGLNKNWEDNVRFSYNFFKGN